MQKDTKKGFEQAEDSLFGSLCSYDHNIIQS